MIKYKTGRFLECLTNYAVPEISVIEFKWLQIF